MSEVRLPEELKPALRNGLPAFIVTSSAAGIPNATIISQVYWVDARHVALSFQFFNKTVRNVRENPRAALSVIDAEQGADWVFDIEFDHSETEGPVFDEMEMQIEAIASASGMSGIFKLRAADVYRVHSVEKIGLEA
jgi:flavin reductase (DIM6/NTAB) family NADH-FMN oxidoreductase RutF